MSQLEYGVLIRHAQEFMQQTLLAGGTAQATAQHREAGPRVREREGE